MALGFSRGKSPSATLALANAVGAATAQGSGAGRSVATLERVRVLLRFPIHHLRLLEFDQQASSDEEYVDLLEMPEASGTTRLIIGPPACSSGTALCAAIDGALEMLDESMTRSNL